MMKPSILLSIALCAISLTESSPKIGGRIVGGKETTIEEFPHQISIRIYGIHWCGGAILKSNIIISAAHCFYDFSILDLRDFTIVAGVTHASDIGVPISIKSVIMHEKFNKMTFDFDIAVVYLESSLVFGDQIQPIGLPAQDEILKIGILALVSGWGALRENYEEPDALYYVELPIRNSSVCSKIYRTKDSNIVCAGYEGHDACSGDSGGPMVIENKLIGIVSGGRGCARPNFPGVLTKVSNFRNWIDANTN